MLIYFLIIIILLVLILNCVNKEHFIVNSTIIDRRFCAKAIQNLNKLTSRVNSLELMLHQRKYHSAIKKRIDLMKKKYDASYRYYKQRVIELKKKSNETLKAFTQ
jgi:hypothetical protein